MPADSQLSYNRRELSIKPPKLILQVAEQVEEARSGDETSSFKTSIKSSDPPSVSSGESELVKADLFKKETIKFEKVRRNVTAFTPTRIKPKRKMVRKSSSSFCSTNLQAQIKLIKH